MEDKISVLELYKLLNDAFKSLPLIYRGITDIVIQKICKCYKYNGGLYLYIHQITLEKNEVNKIIIEYRYCKDKSGNKDSISVSEKIEITIDEQNSLNFRTIEMVNELEDLEYLPQSVLNKPVYKFFDLSSIKNIFNLLNNIDPELKFLFTINYNDSRYIIKCIPNIKSDETIFNNKIVHFELWLDAGFFYMNLNYFSKEYAYSYITSFIQDIYVRAYLEGKIENLSLGKTYIEILDLASNTYVDLKDLPENIREYIRYIKCVDAENKKVKELTNK